MKTKLCSLVLLASQLTFAAASRGAEGFVAHEWGTFTSVQGADGIQLEWNPLVTSELPPFVYNSVRRVGGRIVWEGKGAYQTLQRMETPVIYFYSDTQQKVGVTVDFPQGIVTEWFPLGKQSAPSTANLPPRTGRQIIRWENIEILPLRQNASLAGALPSESSGSHYYAARATDADYLRVDASGAKGGAEVEKFLFYRGVGNFRAPLTVSQLTDGSGLVLTNSAPEPLGNLFVYTVRGNEAKFVSVGTLASGSTRSVALRPDKNLAPLSDVRADLARRLRESLVGEGLYEREAAAMVQTWDESWFGEQGTRVLYTLPRAWTDRTLPLTIEPRPRELARVMIGRAELISPEMEWNLLKQVVRFADADAATRARIIDETRKLGYGRFMEPTTRRLMPKVPGREFSKLSWELLEAASKPAPKEKVVAAK
ncbi:MAG TPA: hypothetical protein VFT34_05705 [Verrucomicrobiae bacterium]|nr:hypothetical protein [Verrucomicrobiae bacterium]